MKWAYQNLLLAGLLLGLLAGCNWTQIVAFRAQMCAVAEYTSWEAESGERIFVFRAPLLTMGDLNQFGIYPELIDQRKAVLRYHRVDLPPGTPGEYDIHLRFTEGRLTGLVFPQPLRDGLGQDNITGLFAMIGGGDAAGAGINPMPKQQLIAAGLFAGTVETLGREVVVELEPLDPRNRPIHLKMEEGRQADYYSNFYLNLKRRPSG